MADETMTAEQLIGRLIDNLDPGSFVTKFIVVAEVIDTEGIRATWCTGSDDLMRWDSYGLLVEAMQTVKAEHAAAFRDDEL